MKHYYKITLLLSAALIPITVVKAQPTLTGAKNNFSIGHVFTLHGYDAESVPEGNSGANTTWDFSGISSLGSDTYTVQNSSAGPHASSYPNANMFIDMSNGETYLLINNSEYSFTGIYQPASDVSDYYTDPRELVKYPITYQDVFNETMSGTQTNNTAGITYDRSGTIKIEGDGYGTLIMPYGTINNVLRVRTITTYGDEFMGTPVLSYNDTLYSWWHPEITGYILSYSIFESSGLTLRSGFYLDPSLVGTEELSSIPQLLNVYPNPASEVLNVNYELLHAGNVQLSLRNLLGQKVKILQDGLKAAGIHKVTLNVSDLTKGVYMLEVAADEQVITQKVLIQ